MFSTHLVLISTNQTTVEHLAAHNTKDRENALLDEMYSCCAIRFVPAFFLLPPMHFCFWRIELYWVKFSGRRGKRDKRGTQSMDVLGARLTCGGLAPCARTGNRSSDRVRGHGSVSLSPICSSPLPSTPYLYPSHCVSRRN